MRESAYAKLRPYKAPSAAQANSAASKTHVAPLTRRNSAQDAAFPWHEACEQGFGSKVHAEFRLCR